MTWCFLMLCFGVAVFEVGDGNKKVEIEFQTIAELRDKEDELTWAEWPNELKIVSIDYKPAKTTIDKKAA